MLLQPCRMMRRRRPSPIRLASGLPVRRALGDQIGGGQDSGGRLGSDGAVAHGYQFLSAGHTDSTHHTIRKCQRKPSIRPTHARACMHAHTLTRRSQTRVVGRVMEQSHQSPERRRWLARQSSLNSMSPGPDRHAYVLPPCMHALLDRSSLEKRCAAGYSKL